MIAYGTDHLDADGKVGLRTVSLADVEQRDVPRLTTAGCVPLWPGYLTALVGPGESGKTWLGVHCVLDVAEQGQAVLVVDGEMSAPAWRHRLIALGAADEQLGRVHYTEMADDSANIEQVRATVAELDARLIVWDSALSLISRTARSENDNAEVSRVYDRLRVIVRDGPAGLIVDHTAAGAQTAVSRGATAKFNALDLAYGVRLDDGQIPDPLNDWTSIITVEKDRHGLLTNRNDRQALFHPIGHGGLVLDIAELVGASHRLSATNPVDTILTKIAELDPPPTSGNDVYRRVGGNRIAVLAAYKKWSHG